MRKKALFIIDVQPATLSSEAKNLLPAIADYIARSNYDAYVEAIYYADKESMFFKQESFYLPPAEAGEGAPEIAQAVQAKKRPYLMVKKNTRSLFSAFNKDELEGFLQAHRIEEIHLLGFDINDCVLSSAYAAIDKGYYTYVLGDLSHHHSLKKDLKDAALAILDQQSMLKTSDEVK